MFEVFLVLVFAGLLSAGGAVAAMGRREGGKRSDRGIRRLFRRIRKNGWEIPEWLTEKEVFRTWIFLTAGSGILMIWSVAQTGERTKVDRLERPAYGEGSVQEELELEWEEQGGEKGREKILVEVEEQELTPQEKADIFFQVKERLDTEILGENTRLEHICFPLALIERLEDFPASISWFSSDPSLVDWEGNLGTDIPEQGEEVCLTASIQVGGEEETYVQYVRVYPPQYSMEEQLHKLLEDRQKNTDEKLPDTERMWLELPQEVGDRRISWKRKEESVLQGAALFLLLVPILLLMRKKQEAEERRKQEHRELEQDYPEIVSKLVLLLGAGINLRRSIERVAIDYKKYKKQEGERKSYEVLLELCEEMERGVSEKEAYERLGERCKALPYRTLSALLVQHLQKGSHGMERILEEEAARAQEMRLQQARILGEQASTRLLVPMILMLLIVFVILLAPAWLSFAV